MYMKKSSNFFLFLISALVSFGLSTPVKGQSTSGFDNGHEWVDLELSVKWATCNVGALSSSDYGHYFAWGEAYTKSDYTWGTLRYASSDSGKQFSKYNTDSNYGAVDNYTRLDWSDDAARVNWGGKWRMPTRAEFNELRSNCTWTWVSQRGIAGYKVTSNKNGKSIFLPAAGFQNGLYVHGDGSDGYYWSSSLDTGDPDCAWRLRFESSYISLYHSPRFGGFSVRPVTE